MKPENIDNLFKERLGNSAPTPPADMWARLQQRMEEEQLVAAPAPQPEPEKSGKQRFLWMYSSVAATLSLLLTVGVVFYNIKTGTPEISESLTKHDTKQPQELPLSTPGYTSPAETELAQQAETPITVEAQPSVEEKNTTTQATATNQLASNNTKAAETNKALASNNPKAVQRPSLAKTSKVSEPAKANAQPAIASVKKPVAAEPAAPATTTDATVPATAIASRSDANMNAEPVEIIIKRSVAAQTAMAGSNEQNEGNKKVALAKNIFKQVRNLASGEGVELADLGIRADRVALETKIGKQKISKVINL